MNRREFTLLSFASAFSASSNVFALQKDKHVTGSSLENSHNSLFSAYDDNEGKHHVASLDMNEGNLDDLKINSLEIPFRAHATLPLSAQKSLSFGRRPHNQMVSCDFESQQKTIIEAQNGRHFYGHGCLHQESHTLFTTENDYDGARGVIGLRDSQDFHQIGEYESYGVGPHDIHLMPDRKTLVVANGGIQTHPDYGRRKLNLDTMQPSLVFIDMDSGKKIDEYRLPNHKLSIRHLAITPTGEIGIGTQFQGGLAKDTPNFLLAWLGKDDKEGLHTLNDSQDFTRSCHGYIADVAVDSNSQILAATSPRGNNVSLWDIKDLRLINTVKMTAPSGIYFDQIKQQFLVSNEKGVIYGITSSLSPNSNQSLATKIKEFPVKWDNHMIIHT